jgi:hypothetical protein
MLGQESLPAVLQELAHADQLVTWEPSAKTGSQSPVTGVSADAECRSRSDRSSGLEVPESNLLGGTRVRELRWLLM